MRRARSSRSTSKARASSSTEARLRYSKKELPREGLDRGFAVRRLARSLRPEELRAALATLPDTSQTTATASNLVLVDLLIVTPDPREQVVVEDPLPAGLEAVDSNLATTAQSLDVTNAGGAGDDSNGDDGEDARANGLAYTLGLVPPRDPRRPRAHLRRAHARGHVPLPLPRPRDDHRDVRRAADARRVHVRAGGLRAHGGDDVSR